MNVPLEITADQLVPRPQSFVYVFMADDGTCKVGVSRHPIKRKRDIERVRGKPLAIYIVYPTWRAFEIEHRAHELLDAWAIGYEWFRCCPLKAAIGVEAAAKDVGQTVKPHQLMWDRPYPDFTFVPAVEGVQEPSAANVALWRLTKDRGRSKFYWPALPADDDDDDEAETKPDVALLLPAHCGAVS